MARGGRSKTPSVAGRVAFTPQRYRPAVPRQYLKPVRLSPINVIGSLEDRRLWHPDRLPRPDMRPPIALPRQAARVVLRPRSGAANRAGKRTTLQFALPERVSMCAKRHIRRQVLFASKRTTRGPGRSPRRNFWSAISCRRK